MLTMEGVVEVRVLARQGKKIREIAREIGLSRNTVRRYMRSNDPSRYRRTVPRPSKLDPHREYIARRLAEAAHLTATVLLRELRDRGYSGGISILKDHMAQVRPRWWRSSRWFGSRPGPASRCRWIGRPFGAAPTGFRSLWLPLASRLRAEGMVVDVSGGPALAERGGRGETASAGPAAPCRPHGGERSGRPGPGAKPKASAIRCRIC